MSSISVPLAGGLAVVVLGAALWWTTGPDSAGPEGAPVPVNEEHVPGADAPGEGGANDQGGAGGGDGASSVSAADSPFAPIDDADPDAQAGMANGEPGEPVADDVPDDATDPEVAGAPIVVPSSYPVGDAGKYYLPPGQRSSGNLGGPPPLDFPGGPNDPNRGEGGFAPPPAPGQ